MQHPKHKITVMLSELAGELGAVKAVIFLTEKAPHQCHGKHHNLSIRISLCRGTCKLSDASVAFDFLKRELVVIRNETSQSQPLVLLK